jgi:thioredoxin-related protein
MLKIINKFLILVLLLAPASSLPEGPPAQKPACAEGVKPAWSDYDAAIAAAKKDDKPVLIFFHGRDCRKCEVLEEQGFDRPDLACYLNQKFAAARIMEPDRPDLRKKYRVSSYPTVWFLTPDGGEIDFFVGYVGPEKLALILHYVGDGEYKKKSFAEYEKEREGG